MSDLPAARRLLSKAPTVRYGVVTLTYDERLIRRKRLVTAKGEGFLVDLPEVTNLDLVWGFELEDGRAVQVCQAEEPVLVVTGAEMARYAWHIGNRHTPCQIELGRLVIRADHVLEAMLKQLGADVRHTLAPFSPELGAYGVGRPMGHDHGHDHSHGSGHSHSHVHHHSSHHHDDVNDDETETET